MSPLDRNELFELLYDKTRDILDHVSLAEQRINKGGARWSEKRGDLYDTAKLLTDYDNLIKDIEDSKALENTSDVNFNSIKLNNRRFIERLKDIAKNNLLETYTTLSAPTALKILEIYTDIWNTYSVLLPVLGKFLDNSLEFPLSRLSDSLKDYKRYFSSNWAIAAVHLAMMDSVVNKLREKFGLLNDPEKDSTLPFQQRYKQLVEALKEKGKKIHSVTGVKATVMWTMRTQIMHYAMDPNEKDLETITRWTKNVIDDLTKAGNEVLEA